MQIGSKIKGLVKKGGRILVDMGLLPRLVVLQMDGGICSQMHFLLVGAILESKGQKVVYYLDWFRRSGKDINGNHPRNYDLEKLFPSIIPEKISNGILLKIYRKLFVKRNDYFSTSDPLAWMQSNGPVLFDGYFREWDGMFTEWFPKLFGNPNPEIDAANEAILKTIECANGSGKSCGIHVRRGDLATPVAPYGDPPSPLYFKSAIERIKAESGKVKFFVFSDEPEWFKTEVMPELDQDVELMVCNANGSDKGYMDLFLLSKCRHIISSQGSMGKYAALLRPEGMQDGRVVLRAGDDFQEWRGRLKNSTAIDGATGR